MTGICQDKRGAIWHIKSQNYVQNAIPAGWNALFQLFILKEFTM